MAGILDGSVINAMTILLNARISNVQTLSQTVVNNVHNTMDARKTAVDSLRPSAPSSGSLLNTTMSLLGNIRSRISGLKSQLMNFQITYPQYGQALVVPGQPVQGVVAPNATVIGAGANPYVTYAVGESPLLTTAQAQVI